MTRGEWLHSLLDWQQQWVYLMEDEIGGSMIAKLETFRIKEIGWTQDGCLRMHATLANSASKPQINILWEDLSNSNVIIRRGRVISVHQLTIRSPDF